MRVLVACEFSGIVRDAFLERGHYAMSCDLLPSESDAGEHWQGDVRDVLDWGWDLMIAHPPCTYLAKSGVRWLHAWPGQNGPEKVAQRWVNLVEGCRLFRDLLNAPIPRKAVENPRPHRYAVERIGRKFDQTFQPWQFGSVQTKAVCLWLDNLPPLLPTGPIVAPDLREATTWHMWPSPERSKQRSLFFPEVAQAMAEQWGSL